MACTNVGGFSMHNNYCKVQNRWMHWLLFNHHHIYISYWTLPSISKPCQLYIFFFIKIKQQALCSLVPSSQALTLSNPLTHTLWWLSLGYLYCWCFSWCWSWVVKSQAKMGVAEKWCLPCSYLVTLLLTMATTTTCLPLLRPTITHTASTSMEALLVASQMATPWLMK